MFKSHVLGHGKFQRFHKRNVDTYICSLCYKIKNNYKMFLFVFFTIHTAQFELKWAPSCQCKDVYLHLYSQRYLYKGKKGKT